MTAVSWQLYLSPVLALSSAAAVAKKLGGEKSLSGPGRESKTVSVPEPL